MISRKHRFHGRRGLHYVHQHGRNTRGPSFTIKCLTNPHRQSYRLAVVVSRKVEKSAVARNRLRRRLYEAVRLVEPEINGPYDIILTVFSAELLNEPPKAFNDQVRKQLRAAGILTK